jgi:hypothetical protein
MDMLGPSLWDVWNSQGQVSACGVHASQWGAEGKANREQAMAGFATARFASYHACVVSKLAL